MPKELDKFRPLSPESKRSTMDAEELGKLRMGAGGAALVVGVKKWNWELGSF